MAYPEARDIGIYYGREASPSHGGSFLASASKAFEPRFYNKVSECFQCLVIARYTKVQSESLYDTLQPVPYLVNWLMQRLSQGFSDVPNGLPQSFAYGLPFQKVPSFTGNATQVGKPEKVKRLGLALSAFVAVGRGEAPELYQPGLVFAQLQIELPQPFT